MSNHEASKKLGADTSPTVLLLKATTCGLPGGTQIGSLQLPPWVHFPWTHEAMLTAFTHQRPQKSATYQAAWYSSSKINNMFSNLERGEGGASCLLHCNESKIHHVLLEPPSCSGFVFFSMCGEEHNSILLLEVTPTLWRWAECTVSPVFNWKWAHHVQRCIDLIALQDVNEEYHY